LPDTVGKPPSKHTPEFVAMARKMCQCGAVDHDLAEPPNNTEDRAQVSGDRGDIEHDAQHN
jgi:hypothetical protein